MSERAYRPQEIEPKWQHRVRVERVSDTCGFAVPRYRYEGDRLTLLDWAEKKGLKGVEAYKAEKNRESLDGLPGLLRLIE